MKLLLKSDNKIPNRILPPNSHYVAIIKIYSADNFINSVCVILPIKMGEDIDLIIGFADYLKNIKGLSIRSCYQYMLYHNVFMERELTQESIEKFLNERKNCNVVRAYLLNYLEFLHKEYEFKIPKAKSGSQKKRLIRSISESEINEVSIYCYKKSEKDGIIFDILYWGALRRDEITTVKTNSFDWQDWFNNPSQHIMLRVIGKGDKERKVLVHPKVPQTILNIFMKKGLINLKEMEGSDVLNFLNNADDLLIAKYGSYNFSKWKVWKLVKIYFRDALKREIRTHELRHARATHLADQGADIKDIQIYLGHASVKTTEIYLHRDTEEALKRIRSITKDL